MFEDLLNSPLLEKIVAQMEKDPNHPLNKRFEMDKNKPHIKAGGILLNLYNNFPNLIKGLVMQDEEDLTQEEWETVLQKAEAINASFIDLVSFLRDTAGKSLTAEEREEIEARVKAKYSPK